MPRLLEFIKVICSIEFYRMNVQNRFGKPQIYQGAVVLGPLREQGCEVIRILPPMPTPQLLHEEIVHLYSASLRERCVFLNWTPAEVVYALEEFCNKGIPLPNPFDPNIAVFAGLTSFQKLCYELTCHIEHGDTRSYAWLADRILPNKGAERAVGNAMRTNPFPLLIPCHRILKKDGSLGGYMGMKSGESWQLILKKTLLEMECSHQQPSLFASIH